MTRLVSSVDVPSFVSADFCCSTSRKTWTTPLGRLVDPDLVWLLGWKVAIAVPTYQLSLALVHIHKGVNAPLGSARPLLAKRDEAILSRSTQSKAMGPNR